MPSSKLICLALCACYCMTSVEAERIVIARHDVATGRITTTTFSTNTTQDRGWYNIDAFGPDCGSGALHWLRRNASFASAWQCDSALRTAADNCSGPSEWGHSSMDYDGQTRRTFSQAAVRYQNGFDTKTGQFPSFVVLRYKPYTTKYLECGGTLVHKDLVVTAAHCVRNKDVKKFGFMAGTVHQMDKFRQGHYRNIRYIWMKAGQDLEHDIAVVKLSRPFRYSDRIQPACLYKQPSRTLRDNRICIAVGPSHTRLPSPGRSLPDRVQAAPMSPCGWKKDYPSSTCYRNANPRKPGGLGACAGDSGGPMFCLDSCDGRTKQVLVGLLSRGSCCRKKLRYCHGIYSNLIGNWAYFNELLRLAKTT